MKSILVLVSLFAAGCAVEHHHRSNALEYLYPAGAPAAEPRDVQIHVPVRVGLAFAPASQRSGDPFSEAQKQTLLARVAEKFRERKGIAPIQVIPSSQLTPGGGFAELDRIKKGFGIDLVALVSYDQFQFSESAKSSWTYWTLVGAYVVAGEKNETRTVMDAVVYDIASRAMLFHASGNNSNKGSSTPVELGKKLRAASEEGFQRAVEDLVGKLDTALAAFQEQAASGTVHGPGTPGLAMVDAEGHPVPAGSGGGAGALGVLEIGAVLLLLGLFALGAWRRA